MVFGGNSVSQTRFSPTPLDLKGQSDSGGCRVGANFPLNERKSEEIELNRLFLNHLI